MELKYIGHSAFEIQLEKNSILIDPFVEHNENYNWHDINVTDIFVTHAHSDHLGQAIEIAKEKDATITAIVELAQYLKEQGCKVNPVNFGGWINYDWGRAVFVPASHTSSLPDGRYAGEAAGIVFDVEKFRIYHAGDTGLTADMKIIKELYRPNIAMLPIGGKYTMDVEHAAVAADWIGAQTVIPMHYGTFQGIEADVQKFISLVQMNNTNCAILDPKKL
ncbi:metal-dependent hydrolase [bacterium]|nr:metal-dependent hydrolase [bacterium]